MLENIFTGQRNLSLVLWIRKHKIDNGFARALYKSLDDPDEVPYLLKPITDGFSGLRKKAREEVRSGLLRVQIHCSIHGNSDPIKLSKQLYISQTLEKLMFGSNLLMDGIEEEVPVRKIGKKR